MWLPVHALGTQLPPTKSELPPRAIFYKYGQLYRAYLGADPDHARQDLQDMVKLGETTQKLELGVQANALFRDYSWLYALEKRAGNRDLAELYFAKANIG